MSDSFTLQINGISHFHGSFSYSLKKQSTLVLLEGKLPFIEEMKEELKKEDGEVAFYKNQERVPLASLAFSSDCLIYPNLTVKDNLSCFIKGNKKEVESELKRVAMDYELFSLLDRKAKDLPSAVYTRLLLAKLFYFPHEAIVFASPFKGNDLTSFKEYLRFFKKADAPILYLAKNVYEALLVTDTLVTNPLTDEEEVGDPLVLLSDPKKKKTLETLYPSKMNVIPFYHEEKGIKLLDAFLPFKSDEDGFYLIHEKYVAPQKDGEYVGKVLYLEGNTLHVQSALSEVKMEAKEQSFGVGEEVHFTFDIDKGYYFTNKGERITLNLIEESKHEKSS